MINKATSKYFDAHNNIINKKSQTETIISQWRLVDNKN